MAQSYFLVDILSSFFLFFLSLLLFISAYFVPLRYPFSAPKYLVWFSYTFLFVSAISLNLLAIPAALSLLSILFSLIRLAQIFPYFPVVFDRNILSLSIVTILSSILIDPSVLSGDFVAYSGVFLENPNAMGRFSSFILIYFISSYSIPMIRSSRRGYIFYFWLFSAVTLLILLLLAQSRASVLSLVVYLFLLLCFKFSISKFFSFKIRLPFRRISVSTLLAICLSASILLVLLQPTVSGGIVRKHILKSDDSSPLARLSHVDSIARVQRLFESLNMIPNYPLGNPDHEFDPHNNFLSQSLKYGLPFSLTFHSLFFLISSPLVNLPNHRFFVSSYDHMNSIILSLMVYWLFESGSIILPVIFAFFYFSYSYTFRSSQY